MVFSFDFLDKYRSWMAEREDSEKPFCVFESGESTKIGNLQNMPLNRKAIQFLILPFLYS